MARSVQLQALLLLLFAVSLKVSSAARIGPFDCQVCRTSTINGEKICSFYYTTGAPNDCKTGAGFSCAACPNPTAGKDPNCACKLSCQIDDGTKDSLWYCECQKKAQGTMCSDPHFRGAFGIEYDFHGQPDKHFSLVTDKDLNVNAHFIGQDSLSTGFDGTWISAVGIKWNEGLTARELTIEVKQSADLSTAAGSPFVFRFGDQELAPGTSSERTLYDDDMLTVRRYADVSTYFVAIPGHLNITVAAAAHEYPRGNHIDIRIEKLFVTGTVHGALGQTFAELRREALRAAAADVGTAERFDASDVIEGKDLDYMTSGLLAADSRFNRYLPPGQSTVTVPTMNVMRRLLAEQQSLGAAVETVGFACENVNGSLQCHV